MPACWEHLCKGSTPPLPEAGSVERQQLGRLQSFSHAILRACIRLLPQSNGNTGSMASLAALNASLEGTAATVEQGDPQASWFSMDGGSWPSLDGGSWPSAVGASVDAAARPAPSGSAPVSFCSSSSCSQSCGTSWRS